MTISLCGRPLLPGLRSAAHETTRPPKASTGSTERFRSIAQSRMDANTATPVKELRRRSQQSKATWAACAGRSAAKERGRDSHSGTQKCSKNGPNQAILGRANEKYGEDFNLHALAGTGSWAPTTPTNRWPLAFNSSRQRCFDSAIFYPVLRLGNSAGNNLS